jgi:hypothetical protein
VKLLLVFQSVDVQNFTKIGDQEGHQFEYQSVGV